MYTLFIGTFLDTVLRIEQKRCIYIPKTGKYNFIDDLIHKNQPTDKNTYKRYYNEIWYPKCTLAK